jgi:ATP-binding cassette subfamily B protein
VRLEMHKVERQGTLDIATIESSEYQNLLRSAQEWGSVSVLNLQDFVFTTANNLAGLITSIIILWMLNPLLVLFAILAAFPIYFVYKKYSIDVYRIRFLSIGEQRIISDRISHFEHLQKAVDVILFGLKDWLKNQIFRLKTDHNEKILNAEKRKTIWYTLLSVWYLVFLVGAMFVVTYDVTKGLAEIGSLVLAFNTYSRFYQTFNNYVESLSITEEAARYAERWFTLFNLKPGITSRAGAIRIPNSASANIEFRNVSFKYNNSTPGDFVLKNISFSITPGQKVAIVGLNGAGKTTLIKLLCRVYDPTEGAIFVNGHDLRDINLDEWRNSLAILFQDFPIYNLSVRESVHIGKISDPLNEKKFNEAIKQTGADSFVNDYDQLIWREFQGGIELSRGQHQRLALSRIFYRDAPITILDEPTASVDALAAEKLFQSINTIGKERTYILITHKFSAVRQVDNILVLEDGKLIEQGAHAQLMALTGRYFELYNLQATAFQPNDSVPEK